MTLLLALILAGTPLLALGAPQSAPKCSVPGHAVAVRKTELPPDVLREVDSETADPGQPFRKTDAAAPGEEELPAMRLICGYRTLSGYVVEREHGGRAYTVGKMLFRKTPTGYSPAHG